VIEESAATEEVAALYDHFRTHFGRPDVPGILKCFATHPPLLRQMMDLSESLIFAEGALTRKHKEMIATLVSAQNSCPYCADSHGFFLRVHGGTAQTLAALQTGDLGSSGLSAADQALLNFARKVNLASHQIDREDVNQTQNPGKPGDRNPGTDGTFPVSPHPIPRPLSRPMQRQTPPLHQAPQVHLQRVPVGPGHAHCVCHGRAPVLAHKLDDLQVRLRQRTHPQPLPFHLFTEPPLLQMSEMYRV
jgi:uncharacterized peroxidase-related enzyme